MDRKDARYLRLTAGMRFAPCRSLRASPHVALQQVVYQRTVIQNWQTPEVNGESDHFDLYSCAWIEKLKSAN
ncbi:hypothetical protein BROC_01976 [Candidatus Brocadiaceae bacterium]|nr:hypothetical protein BROC_01976 [Candidatus Brocadiaceae bacterium]